MELIKQASREILRQLIDLAENLSDGQFTGPLPVLSDNSIGKHYRHVIEYYQLMLEGIHTGVINYDNRRHDASLELSRQKCLEELNKSLRRLSEPFWEDPIELRGSYSLDSVEIYSVRTNAERELIYNMEHAIHHMAIIRMAVQHAYPGIQLKEEFGYAFSTLKHMRK